MRRTLLTVALLSGLAGVVAQDKTSPAKRILALSRAGKTLDLETGRRYPLPEQKIRHDTGINVLVDLSHQAKFVTMWHLPGQLRRLGYRAVGSQASLHSVLDPKGRSRVRIRAAGRRPFAWIANPRFNVVICHQSSDRAQPYLPAEVAALDRFLKAGGGVILIGNRTRKGRTLPIDGVARHYGAHITGRLVRCLGRRVPALAPGPAWRSVRSDEDGNPVLIRRSVGKGRLILAGSLDLFPAKRPKRGEKDPIRPRRLELLSDTLRWVAAGSPPVGGTTRLPKEAGGGGPIYPELEKRVGNVVVYYAANQKPDLLKVVVRDMPRVKAKVEAWLPSKPAAEPMYLILSGGGGGGWAVNAYRPKEVGIISLKGPGILSIFAHELAHTMGGPPNGQGVCAGRWPQGNQGESHAGWFQGKAAALATGRRVSHQPNQLFRFDKKGDALDLAAPAAVNRKRWGKGKDWTKVWYIWQKLDDRYGPTWYPRWRYVQHERWAGQPGRRLTWDEVVEDMSIAVGEDLFPFFRRLGTTLGRERCPRLVFQGKTVELPVAPLQVTPAGPVRLEAIGDWRQPLPRPRRSL